MEVIRRFMNRRAPLVPEAYIGVCDVRDVATAHVKALVSEKDKSFCLIA